MQYNSLTKAERTKYIDRAFEDEESQALSLIRMKTNHHQEETRKKAEFRRRWNSRVNAQNNTFKLYQVFGANVIAEPLFQLVPRGSLPMSGDNLKRLTSHLVTHRVAILRDGGLLDAFRQAYEDISDSDEEASEEYFSTSHENTRRIIFSSVSCVAGSDFAKYVQTFLANKDEIAPPALDD
ncbi:hypothetical protein NMY22_g4923 [Coprinellus aureogranulatus]|nr:hypothetical protein NMY22_g4923 [Coprinellus aureogranulatus]